MIFRAEAHTLIPLVCETHLGSPKVPTKVEYRKRGPLHVTQHGVLVLNPSTRGQILPSPGPKSDWDGVSFT